MNEKKVNTEEAADEVKKGEELYDASAEEHAGETGSGDSFSGNEEEKEETEEEEDLHTKYLRLAADFQNFRRRSEKEKSDVYAYANEKIAVELLDVIDNFERAMECRYEAEETKLMEGMEMILKQLRDVLERNHLQEIEALNKPFDPVYHNAVMQEASETLESGMVTKVLQKGYMLNKKVIRPAMVVVAQ